MLFTLPPDPVFERGLSRLRDMVRLIWEINYWTRRELQEVLTDGN